MTDAEALEGSRGLDASGLSANVPGHFIQGTSAIAQGNGIAFGDGLRRAGGTVVRMGLQFASASTVSLPAPCDPCISVRSQVPSTGGSRVHQLWYRDPRWLEECHKVCTAEQFDLPNGLRRHGVP